MKQNFDMNDRLSGHCSGYLEAVDALYRESPSFQNVGKEGYRPGLGTMLRFASSLQNPQTSFKVIHVAGTNGKGSVSHFLASALSAAGIRTGLYTSPHLLDFRERIKVVDDASIGDGDVPFRMIPEESVLEFLERTRTFRDEYHPSFFEVTTGMAMDWFRKMNVKVAVLECGLGGRMDSTNIVVPELSIITSIGYDHKDILGDTISSIAFEKGGIIKDGVPLVTGVLPPEAFRCLYSIAYGHGSPFHYSPDFYFRSALGRAVASLPVRELDLRSEVQTVNLRTAAAALELFLPDCGAGETERRIVDAVRHTASRTGFRGRWETLSYAPLVICDIGHNENALRPVMSQLKALRAEKNPPHLYMVYGMAQDKDIASVASLLPSDAEYVFTSASGKRAMPPERLKEIIEEAFRKEEGFEEDVFEGRCVTVPSVAEAVRTVMEKSGKDDLIYIGGSSYVVAEALGCFDGHGQKMPEENIQMP